MAVEIEALEIEHVRGKEPARLGDNQPRIALA